MNEFTVKIFMSDRVKKPAEVVDQLFNGTLFYSISEADKYIQWEELKDSTGKVIGRSTVIDWGL